MSNTERLSDDEIVRRATDLFHRTLGPVPNRLVMVRGYEEGYRAALQEHRTMVERLKALHVVNTRSSRCVICGHGWPCPTRAIIDAIAEPTDAAPRGEGRSASQGEPG